MRLEFVKAFVEITETIFNEVLGNNVVTGKLTLASAPQVQAAVVTYIELRGDLVGKILLYMDLPTATAIAQRMMGRQINSRPLIASCIAELTSIAIGRAISWINDQSWNIQMSPPIVTMEVELNPLTSRVETLVFPLQTACGEATLNISVIDSNYSFDNEMLAQN
jgi:CheY-specific phosphatase CheX